MKNFISVTVLILFSCLTVMLTSCASAPKVEPQEFGFDLVAQQGESEIIFMSLINPRIKDKMTGVLQIYVDNELVLSGKPRYRMKIIVPNGSRNIQVDWIAKNGYGANVLVKGEPITLNADSKSYTYNIDLPVWLVGTKVKLELTWETEVGNVN